MSDSTIGSLYRVKEQARLQVDFVIKKSVTQRPPNLKKSGVLKFRRSSVRAKLLALSKSYSELSQKTRLVLYETGLDSLGGKMCHIYQNINNSSCKHLHVVCNMSFTRSL